MPERRFGAGLFADDMLDNLRRFHTNGNGCLTYIQPRRQLPNPNDDLPPALQNPDDFQRTDIADQIVELTDGIKISCNRLHYLDLTHQKTVALLNVNDIYENPAKNTAFQYEVTDIVDEFTFELGDAPKKTSGSYVTGSSSRIYFTGSDNEHAAMICMFSTGDQNGNPGFLRTFSSVANEGEFCKFTYTNHGLRVTASITVIESITGYNGVHTVTSVPTANTFVTDRSFVSTATGK